MHAGSSLRRFLTAAVTASVLVSAAATTTHAATVTNHVAYINDLGSGSDDGTFPGSSIFVNAITGSPVPNNGTYTTGDSALTVTVTNVSVATIDTSGVAALSGFDTVILYEVCDIGSHPATMAAINAYLTAGSGKVLIFDADRCFDADPQVADYSTFLFPFTASTPGPEGASGSYTNVQASTLTTGLSVGPISSDSVGDANTFVTFNPNWCGSITAQNTLGNDGFVEAYARRPTADSSFTRARISGSRSDRHRTSARCST